MRGKILELSQSNPFYRWLFGFFFLFLTMLIIGWAVLYPMRAFYYSYYDGNYFLNVGSVTAEPKVDQDDSLSVVFCREPKARIIAVDNIRTFYLADNGHAVYERRLPDGISYERSQEPCQPLSIKRNQRPNEPGRYRFCQEFDFEVNGYQKTANFCSTEYEVVES